MQSGKGEPRFLLKAGPGKHARSVLPGVAANLGQQGGFAYPGIAAHHQGAARALVSPGDQVTKQTRLVLAAVERTGCALLRHALITPYRRGHGWPCAGASVHPLSLSPERS